MVQRLTAAAILVAGLSVGPSVMAQGDSTELNLWRMVEQRNTPSDYQAYLDLFPTGKFAALARIRVHGPGPGTPALEPEPQPEPDAPQFTVTPMTVRVGQRFSVNCATLPSGSRFDTIVAVRAGSPPRALPEGPQGIASEYVSNCQAGANDGSFLLGPLPPGRWEIRWMSTLYNLENRPEMKAKVEIVVR